MLKNFPDPGGSHRFRPAAWVRVTGDDALVFLQGQFTQDLVVLPAGRVAYGLWLTPKGRVLGDSLVLKGDAKELWIFSEGLSGTALCERLEAYVVADDVILEDLTAGVEAVMSLGVGMANLVDRPGGPLSPGAWRREGDRVGFRGEGRRAGLQFLIGPVGALEPIEPTVPSWDRTQVERWRVAQGLVRVPDDVGPGEFPNEGGLETEAISYTKGCYLGQETVARLKAFGQVRRSVVRIKGDGAPPAERPQALFQSGKRVGELRTTVEDGAGGFVGFALMTLQPWDPAGEAMSLSEAGPPAVRPWP